MPGWESARPRAAFAPSLNPTTDARSIPSAPSTAAASSAIFAIVTPLPADDSPCPRLSIAITRKRPEKAATCF